MTPTGPDERPSGREAIEAALIASTLDLLETRGLDVSIRDIASQADLPHSLIGRYFGSKDRLVQAAIASTLPADREAAAAVDSPLQAVDALFAAGLARPDRLRILVQLLQAGMSPEEIRPEAPLLDLFLAVLEPEAGDSVDQRILAGVLWASAAGWVLTEDFIVHHVGLDDEDRTKVREQVGTVLRGFLERSL